MAAKQKPTIKGPSTTTPGASPAHVGDTKSLNLEALQDNLKDFMKDSLNDVTSLLQEKFKGISDELTDVKNQMLEIQTGIKEGLIPAVQGLASNVILLEEEVDEIKQNNLKMECKMEEMQNKAARADDEIVMIQYKDMEFAIRIRGLKENAQENLKGIFSEVFAEILAMQPEEVANQIDKIYRVNSRVARQRNLARDIVIYFNTRTMRNEILQASFKGEKIQVAGQEISIFKELPPKVLRARKEFAFLVNELKKRQIEYRWDIPIGIIVYYEGKSHRLNTIGKAREFYAYVLQAGRPPSPNGSRKKEELTEKEAIVMEEDLLQVIDISKDGLEAPKDQRMTRATARRYEQEAKARQIQPLVTKTEAVGGARPKERYDLRQVFQKFPIAKNGN